MALTTSLPGRVRNTSLSKSHALLPLHEAVVNAIQAIDARLGEDADQGRVTVRILRRQQGEFDLGPAGPGRTALEPILGFSIEDNGIGFTAENMDSFETLDSSHKQDLGCRGVGRLLWLKAFDKVNIRSAFRDADDQLRGVRFRFSIARDVEPLDAVLEGFDDTGTFVHLDGFDEGYQKSAAKTVEAIAKEVFEHCVWYFLRATGAPEVIVTDGDETFSLKDLQDEFVDSKVPTSSIVVKDKRFNMVNLCLKSSTRNATPRLYWCAGNRVVMEENLTGRVPGLYGKLRDEDFNEFTYVCYLESEFLDKHVRSDRTAFDLSERVPGQSMTHELSFEDIRTGVLNEVERILKEPLSVAREEGKARVHDFVSTTAPRYRPVLARLEQLGATVDPSIKNPELELLLHRQFQKLEAEAIEQGQAVFSEVGSSPPEGYAERLAVYLETVTEINQSDLAAYVSRRHALLDVLEKLIGADDDGKYSREDAIHKLLMPMRTDSNAVGPDASNLWIIDERLAFHDYLASDKTLKGMPITGDKSTKEPDILATRLVDTPVLVSESKRPPLPVITVVEIKRPMRKDASADENPIQQCLDYVKRVRAGGVLTATGRPLALAGNPPAFCYVIADLTQKMIEHCENFDLQVTSDGMGYFGYHRAREAYIEVIGFDRLLNAAQERNRAFFDKLGLPVTLNELNSDESSAA
ncbi:ATP-binding protein [Cellulosimicrobium protaetiae]